MKKLFWILAWTVVLSACLPLAAFGGAKFPPIFGGSSGNEIHGHSVTEPAAGDDGDYLQYDHSAGTYVWDTPAGGGDMTQAVWDGDSDGFIDADAGGTDIDTSSSTGIPQISSGTWSVSATIAHDLTLDDDDAGTALTIRSDYAGDGATVGLLITTDDDDSTNFDPFEIRDDSGANNDLLFFIDHTGAVKTGIWDAAAVTSSGTITSSGIFDVTGANPLTLGSADVTGISLLTVGATTIYDDVNDGNPTFIIGSSAAESLNITTKYEAGGKLLESVTFETKTADTDDHDGEFLFNVDETLQLTINDDGLTVAGDILLSGGNLNTGNIALVVGDATTDTITFTTDGTGDAEIVLRNDSVGDAEIDWEGLTASHAFTTPGITLTGDVTTTGGAYDWDLVDDNASALSFDAAGKAGILAIVTTNDSEAVTMSGGLTVAGAISSTAGTLSLGADPADAGTIRLADSATIIFEGTEEVTALTVVSEALTLGSAECDSITLTTDGTGDAEVTLPTGSIGTAEILDNTITTSDLAATLTFSDGDLVNLGGITISSTTPEGLVLPAYGNYTQTEGCITYDAAADAVKVYDSGSGWVAFGTAAPTNVQYLVAAGSASLSAERILSWGTGIASSEAGDPVTLTVTFDATELDDVTWGNDSTGTWTFDGGGTDATLAYGDNVLTFTAGTSITQTTPLLILGAATDPIIRFNETDGTDWELRVDDTGNSFEIASSAGGVGDNVELEIDEDGDIHVTGDVYVTGDNIFMGADPADSGTIRLGNAAVIAFEDGTEATITHVDDTGFAFNVGLDITGTTELTLQNDETITNAVDGIIAIGGDLEIDSNDPYLFLDATDADDTDWWIVVDADQGATSNDPLEIGNNATVGTSPILTLDQDGDVGISGDLTITGDDLFMTTNTAKFILVADGTNFNPVESTGDVIIGTDGASAIQADTIGTDEMANADHGMVSWTDGAATVEDFALNAAADAGDQNITSLAKLEGYDTGLYLDMSSDGAINLTSDGTLELHSNDWDISTTGVITNASMSADQISAGALNIGGNAFTVNSIEIVGSDGEVNAAAIEDAYLHDGAADAMSASTDGTALLSLTNTDDTLAAETYLLVLNHNEEYDATEHGDFLKCVEDADGTPGIMFDVEHDGDVQMAGDLTVSGDDIFMATNTDTAILIADGTNFNPKVPSGHVTITNEAVTAVVDFALTADADAGDVDIKSIDGLYGVDDDIYIDMGTQGTLTLEADTAINITAPTDFGDEDLSSLDKLEGVDATVYIDLGNSDTVLVESDVKIQLYSPDVVQWEAVNDANPEYRLGSAEAEEAIIQAVYDSGAQGIDYLLIQTQTADETADEGRIVFSVDEATILTVDDGGLELGASKVISGTTAITLGGGSETVAVNSSDWDISAVGAMTNMDAITMDDGSGDSPLLTLQCEGDKALTLQKLDAGQAVILNNEGDLYFQVDNDTDDYFNLSSDATDLTLGVVGGGNLTIDLPDSSTSTLYLDNSTSGQGLDLIIGSATTSGTLTMYDAGTDYKVKIQVSGSSTADATYTLPVAKPSEDQYLKCTSAGVMSWASSTAGDVSVSGTPTDDQIAVWTDASTIEGVNVQIVSDEIRLSDDKAIQFGDSQDMEAMFTSGDSALEFLASAEEMLRLKDVSTAVNEITIINAATGTFPTIQATGEVDTGLDFENSEGEEVLTLDMVATATNWLTISNAADSSSPSIVAVGDNDANVGISIDAKAAGEIAIGSADAKFSLASDALDISNTGALSSVASISIGADPADAGALRFSNADDLMWEADETGTDVNALTVDASEIVQIGSSGASGVTITPATTITGALTLTANPKIYDGDSHHLTLDVADLSADATLVLGSDTNNITLTNGTAAIDIAAAATLNIDKNFTVDGQQTTITGVTQANTITLNESITIGDGNSGTLTYSAASKTLTVEDSATVSQDYSSDATPTFAGILFGSDPADAGTIRLPNAGTIQFEADAAGNDIQALTVDANEALILGDADTTAISLVTTGETYIYDDNNDGNPVFAMGSSAAERLDITATYEGGGKLLEKVTFQTLTEDTDDDDGEFEFKVDATTIATINDGGLNLASGKIYEINGTQINIGDLGAGGNWTPTGTIDFSSSTDTTYKDATIDPADLASTDFGDFTVSEGSATLDTGVVGDNEIDYTNVTLADFDYQTAWRVFYSNADGDVTELALGTNGQYLKSNGADQAPSWGDPSGAGDITAVGPGYAAGAAFTDGVVSTGTTMFVWEGTTDDAIELNIISPTADPTTTDIDLTLPDITGTILATTDDANITATFEIQDDTGFKFGNDADWAFTYDETTDHRLEIVHTAGANADVYWDLNDNAADSTFTITNSDGTYEADLVVEGSITSGSSGQSYVKLTNNTSVTEFTGGEYGIYFEGGQFKAYINTEESTFMTTLTPMGGVILGDSGPDAAGEVGYSDNDGDGNYELVVHGTTGDVVGFALIDADCTDNDNNAMIAANATTFGTGAEVIDLLLKAQVGGTLYNVAEWDGSDEAWIFGDATSGEDLKFDFECTGDNTVEITSGSSVSNLDIQITTLTVDNIVASGAIDLGAAADAAGEIGFDGTNSFSFYGANSEDLEINVGTASNTCTITSNTAVATLDIQIATLKTDAMDIDGAIDLDGGDISMTDTTPVLTLEDSSAEAGTGELIFASSGAYDVIGTIKVDVAGSATSFMEIDGVSETVDILKPAVFSGNITLPNAGVITFTDGTATTITHVDDTGLLINTSLEIDGTLDADGVVALGDGGDNFSVSSDGIDIDTSGNISNAGTVGCGTITSTGNLVIGDAGNIGSASDTDAIAIASDGKVTFSQDVIISGTGIELNHATENTLTAAGGVLSIEGTALVKASSEISSAGVIADSVAVETWTLGGGTSFDDDNITNVGDIDVDSVSADGASVTLGAASDNVITVLDNTPDADDTYNGTVMGGTAGESLTQWDLVFYAADGKFDQADANAAGEFPAWGFVTTAASDTDTIVIVTKGFIRNDGWSVNHATWTKGVPLYLDEGTAGGLTVTAPSDADDCVQPVARVVTCVDSGECTLYVDVSPTHGWADVPAS